MGRILFLQPHHRGCDHDKTCSTGRVGSLTSLRTNGALVPMIRIKPNPSLGKQPIGWGQVFSLPITRTGMGVNAAGAMMGSAKLWCGGQPPHPSDTAHIMLWTVYFLLRVIQGTWEEGRGKKLGLPYVYHRRKARFLTHRAVYIMVNIATEGGGVNLSPAWFVPLLPLITPISETELFGAILACNQQKQCQ